MSVHSLLGHLKWTRSASESDRMGAVTAPERGHVSEVRVSQFNDRIRVQFAFCAGLRAPKARSSALACIAGAIRASSEPRIFCAFPTVEDELTIHALVITHRLL